MQARRGSAGSGCRAHHGERRRRGAMPGGRAPEPIGFVGGARFAWQASTRCVGLWVAAGPGSGWWRTDGRGIRANPRSSFIYRCILGPHISGFVGLRVRVSNFEIRYQIPVGFEVVPALTPAGTNPDPNPRPTGSVSADLRVFRTRCHLEVCATAGCLLN